MSVRAKFKVVRIERTSTSVPDGFEENGRAKYKKGELQTIVLSPVYGNGDPSHENTKFWQYTPSGEIKLGTVNQRAAEYFELGKEYYIDFTNPDEPILAVPGPAYADIAASAYYAYAASVGNKAFDGSELPNWDDVRLPIRIAWEAAIRQALTVFESGANDPSTWAGWVPPHLQDAATTE